MPNLTAPQLAQLTTRLQQADVSSLPDWAAANVLNTPNPSSGTVSVPVSASALRRALTITDSGWTRMEAALTGTPTPTAAVVTAINDLLNIASLQDTVEVNPDVGIVSEKLTTLVTAGTITAATRDAVTALGSRPRSWAESVGFSVDARDVGLARGGRA